MIFTRARLRRLRECEFFHSCASTLARTGKNFKTAFGKSLAWIASEKADLNCISIKSAAA